jgi:hypothetical protein
MTVSMLLVNTIAACERWLRHDLFDLGASRSKLEMVR